MTESFKNVLRDYSYLMDNGYPARPAAKLVGDRYGLTGFERVVLFRGITSREKARSRRSKIIHDLKSKRLYVDGYNVIFTVMNYLTGKSLFIANDGMVRDSGETYGDIEDETLFYKAVDLIFDFIKTNGVSVVVIYLDGPVSGSVSHRDELERRFRNLGIEGEVVVVKRVDGKLKGNSDGVIATSDSEIMDGVDCGIYDLPRKVLENNYTMDLQDLSEPFYESVPTPPKIFV